MTSEIHACLQFEKRVRTKTGISRGTGRERVKPENLPWEGCIIFWNIVIIMVLANSLHAKVKDKFRTLSGKDLRVLTEI